MPRLRDADLLFVIGTSLKVRPFSLLTELVPESAPRVLINMEPAGDLGTRADDIVLLGRCDEIVRELCAALGWTEELDREWAKTEILVPLDVIAKEEAHAKEDARENAEEHQTEAGVAGDAGEQQRAVTATGAAASQEPAPAMGDTAVAAAAKTAAEDARVEAEVGELVEKIGKALDISEGGGSGSDEKTRTISPPGPDPTGAPVVANEGTVTSELVVEQPNSAQEKGTKERL